MRILTKIKSYSGALILSMCCLATSCDFLDVVPPEQAELPDATKNHTETLRFLYSCYAGIMRPIDYTGSEASADEFALPQLWGHRSHLVSYDQNLPNSPDHRWGRLYRFIGQSHLFLQELVNAKGITEAERAEWAAEAKFMIAYYHFEVLRFYGPCPITDSYIDMDTPNAQYPGRSHYDYVSKWILDKLDEAYSDLPETRSDVEWGRATKVIADALKAKVLLYAASPLWNGKFPYTDWKNKNFETPGYGKELVSHDYDPQKWVNALDASQKALDMALANGCSLFKDCSTLVSNEKVSLPFVPGREADTPENNDFKMKVLLMRYLSSTRPIEGNKEFVWGLNSEEVVQASLPTRVVKLSNNTWWSGYTGISPYLNTIEHFYTEDGKLPAEDELFYDKQDWLKSADIEGREDIINLVMKREPRFYAWMAFPDGDYSSMLSNGKPLQLKMRDGEAQGYNPGLFNRDHCVTGFLSQKRVRPNLNLTPANSWNLKSCPTPLIRLAELYLNLAECQANVGGAANMKAAIENVNVIRRRAGVPELNESDVKGQKDLIEKIQNERFVEFWNEGVRYYDVRRWAEGAKYLSANTREGLNAEQKVNPTFDEYFKRVKVPQPYAWSNRMYLGAVFINEVYKNPQMIQAPGY